MLKINVTLVLNRRSFNFRRKLRRVKNKAIEPKILTGSVLMHKCLLLIQSI